MVSAMIVGGQQHQLTGGSWLTMNKKKTIKSNNDLLKLIKFRSRHGRKEGCVRVHRANTLLHERVKMEIVYWLLKNEYIVYTEAEWKDESGRADIVAIQNGQGFIIEVLASESEKKYASKEMKYPKEFTMVKVNAHEFDYDKFEL